MGVKREMGGGEVRVLEMRRRGRGEERVGFGAMSG